MSILNEIKTSYKLGSNLTRLTYINLAVFLLYNIIKALLFVAGTRIGSSYVWLFAVPADLGSLITHPWTLLTYMFFHEDFLHILFNMLWLYWFGKLFLQFLTQVQLVGVYILGGLSGAVLFILAYNLLPAFGAQGAVALGASASVMAIVFAVSTLRPNYEIYLLFLGAVKLKYLAIATIVIDIISIPAGNAGGHIAHLGGALFGYLFALMLTKGTDLTAPIKKLATISFKRKRRTKMKVNYSRPETDWEYNSRKQATQKELDAILDKISKSGYGSLTKEEKDALFKMKGGSS